ncbi:embryogenesis-associated protein EMB8-like isoform X2 [Impatiens glandulifera]|uniref:embryogenesis-associated protein EMB8-like isoform X2 n=1 Tax=Impatiens glandulifera TaxID=253017 RepID=UPI001FB15EE0|nr:embryogenesis-associated protein EMB8-like isoform X2 [Impatiens glandulifera]
MDSLNSHGTCSDSPYKLLIQAASLIPIHHYLAWIFLFCLIFLYHFLELHLLHDLFTGFRGQPVSLTFHSRSELYQKVVSNCQILHGRYLSTPWLPSPHLQTTFLSFRENAPTNMYTRQLMRTSDGGTVALDWLKHSDVSDVAYQLNDAIPKHERTPIVIVIPGLTSDSTSAYVKHFALAMEKSGWNVVVSNHRGLGGISITSDCFYNAGWTEDVREVIGFIHKQYQEAPLFIVGTSVGANVLVKYLGEEGNNTPIVGAVAICSPWDALICDRFLNRRTLQKLYGKALAVGLKSYAKLHQSIFSRLTDWEGVEKACSLREFDTHATRVLGKYETVDTYYRRCSSSNFVGGILVPLLCINALDDPICTKEAIAWDECRLNENIVLATTQHGGHLAFFEGLTAKSLCCLLSFAGGFGPLMNSLTF